jgi:hypothetical protein
MRVEMLDDAACRWEVLPYAWGCSGRFRPNIAAPVTHAAGIFNLTDANKQTNFKQKPKQKVKSALSYCVLLCGQLHAQKLVCILLLA